jgi:hypothetical protein
MQKSFILGDISLQAAPVRAIPERAGVVLTDAEMWKAVAASETDHTWLEGEIPNGDTRRIRDRKGGRNGYMTGVFV